MGAMELTDTDRANIERARRVAAGLGYVLNPDPARTLKVSNLLAVNFAAHGKYFCPCKQSEPLDPAKDVPCPCPTLKAEIEKDGHCFCRLFYTAEAAATGPSVAGRH